MRGMRANRRAVLAAGAAAVLAAGIIAGTAGTAAAATGPGAVGFGINSYGELGDGYAGGTASSSSPVQVSGLPASVTQVAGSTSTSAALLPDGTVWVWGNVELGQLGNGTAGLGSFVTTPPSRCPG
jgi:alpha-tubulin suppressor-like RCC1 family protein